MHLLDCAICLDVKKFGRNADLEVKKFGCRARGAQLGESSTARTRREDGRREDIVKTGCNCGRARRGSYDEPMKGERTRGAPSICEVAFAVLGAVVREMDQKLSAHHTTVGT